MSGGNGGTSGGGAGGTGYTGQSGAVGKEAIVPKGSSSIYVYAGGGGGGGTGYSSAGAGGAGYQNPQSGGAAGTSTNVNGGNGVGQAMVSGGGGGGGFAGGEGAGSGSGGTFVGGSGGNGGTGSPSQTNGSTTLSGGGGGGGAGGAGFYSDTGATATFANDVIGGQGGNGGTGGVVGGGGDGGSGVQDGAARAAITFAAGYIAKGGAGGSGSGGAFGGAGIRFTGTGSSALLTNNGKVTGGIGGYDVSGVGGSGGAGVAFAATGSMLTDNGSITGGAGGGGSAGTGAGGAGVTGTGLTIADGGSITGGMGATQADAITFLGGRNTLALGANASISGAVDIQDNGTLTFDQSAMAGALANATLATSITGNGQITKVGNGTLTLSGDNTYTGGTNVTGGKLSVSSDVNLGTGGLLTINNGTLETTASFGTTRQVELESNATVQVDTGTVILGGRFVGSGILNKTGIGTLELGAPSGFNGATISAGTLAFDAPTDGGAINFAPLTGGAEATLALTQNAQPTNGTDGNMLVNFNAGSVLDLKGYIVTSSKYGGDLLTLTGTLAGSSQTTSETYRFDNPTGAPLAIASDGSGGTDITICFAAGTRIRVRRNGAEGDVAVEHLEIGDLASTASGRARPIHWLGHRTVDCRRDPAATRPVRIAAHAFGPNRPARDLTLSPGHPVLVGAEEDGEGGQLVPIMCLINGTTIDRVAVDEVTYWHVELDAHDILLAEGLPAESYIDLGSRPWFAGADGALYDPDMAAPGMPGRCRPVAVAGPIVEAERRRLDALFARRLAAACAWPSEAWLA